MAERRQRINISNYEVVGFDHAIRGMRNPMNSWDKIDSKYKCPYNHPTCVGCRTGCGDNFCIGKNDLCSTMHKIQDKEFTFEDFSHEHLIVENGVNYIDMVSWLQKQIDVLNQWRLTYLDVDKSPISAEAQKRYWWQMIQLLPSSYNQKRTIMLNYEVLAGIYEHRKNHKLDEWHEFCDWALGLPYFKQIIGIEEE